MIDDDDDFDDLYDDQDDTDCDCEWYDVDLFLGTATCYRCHRGRGLTDEQLRAEIEHQAAYMECAEVASGGNADGK